ncbi:VOC family protein [Paenibacillus tuaregi]|uniref:VOC family protein n=1 Tax=Paenibacillus tuaregi TaxID=1816681 RepID=UPI0008389289|nr:VOC family protein [Paenibacillus tuaregi]
MSSKLNDPSVGQSPLKNKIGSVFLPVRDIGQAREWYSRILGFNPADAEIIAGHLCPLPMEGTGLILDTMPMWGGAEEGGAPSISTPAFMFLTDDLEASYKFMQENDVTLVTEIMYEQWFVIQDPDGNKLMVAKE